MAEPGTSVADGQGRTGLIGQDLPFHSEEVNRRGLKQGRANGAVGIRNCEGHSAGGDIGVLLPLVAAEVLQESEVHSGKGAVLLQLLLEGGGRTERAIERPTGDSSESECRCPCNGVGTLQRALVPWEGGPCESGGLDSWKE